MKFRLRPVRKMEVLPGDPRNYALEVNRGHTIDIFPVTPEDIAALNALVLQFNAGADLPIEAEGSGLP